MLIFWRNLSFLILTILTISDGMPYKPLEPENTTTWPENTTEILAEKLTMLGLKGPRKKLETEPKTIVPNITVQDSSKSNKTLSKINGSYDNLPSSSRRSFNFLTLKNLFHRKSNSKDPKSIDESGVKTITDLSPENSSYNSESGEISDSNKDKSESYNSNNELFFNSDFVFGENLNRVKYKLVPGTSNADDKANVLDLTQESEATTAQSQTHPKSSQFNGFSGENTLILLKDLDNFAGAIYNMDEKSFSEHLSNQDTMMENAKKSDDFGVNQVDENIEEENDDELGRKLEQEQSLLEKLWSGLSNTITVLSTQLTARRHQFENLDSEEK